MQKSYWDSHWRIRLVADIFALLISVVMLLTPTVSSALPQDESKLLVSSPDEPSPATPAMSIPGPSVITEAKAQAGLDETPVKPFGSNLFEGNFIRTRQLGLNPGYVIMPGDRVEMNIELIAPIAMEKELRFAIREGGRTVGAGVVVEVVE